MANESLGPVAGERLAPRVAARVLVADDDQDCADTLGALLGLAGYEVRGVRSALQVREAILDFAPDVVLLDIGMPEMSGYEVARVLRKVYGSARPVLVALTGRTDEMDKRIAQLSGFDHHVGKPYEADALLHLLDTILARRGRKHS